MRHARMPGNILRDMTLGLLRLACPPLGVISPSVDLNKVVFFKFYFELFTSTGGMIRWPSSLRHRGSLLLSRHTPNSVWVWVEMREAPGHGAISTQLDLRFSLVSVVLTSGGSGRTTMNSNILSDYYCTLMNHSSLLRSLKIEVNHCIYCSKTKHALTQRLSTSRWFDKPRNSLNSSKQACSTTIFVSEATF